MLPWLSGCLARYCPRYRNAALSAHVFIIPFCVSKDFRCRKFSSKGGRKLHGFVENFFYLTGPNKLRQGTVLCFRKFLVGKNLLWIIGREGVSRFSVENFLSHCPELFHWRTLWCFRKILLSKSFMHRRGRGITVLSKFFVSQDRNGKLCEGTLLFCGKFLVSKKNVWIRRGISQFSAEIFMSHSAENFREGILLFLRKFLVSQSFMDERGCITFFRQKFLSHSAEKFHGHPFNVSENLGYRKILCIIGGSQFAVENFLSYSAEKLRKGTL